MQPPKEKFERENVPFQSAYDWMEDEQNRISPDIVQSGVEVIGFVIAVVIILSMIFN